MAKFTYKPVEVEARRLSWDPRSWLVLDVGGERLYLDSEFRRRFRPKDDEARQMLERAQEAK